MPDSDLALWYRSVPEITRYWFTGSIVLPLLGRFGLLSPWWCVLEYTLFIKKFQVRPNVLQGCMALFRLICGFDSRYGDRSRLCFTIR